jgi:hypothetical protein
MPLRPISHARDRAVCGRQPGGALVALGVLLLLAPLAGGAQAAPPAARPRAVGDTSVFAPLLLPTPNEYRTGSGAPGPRYWQNRADYDIAVELDDAQRRISGSATITYHNRSPDTLDSLWLQLDQNYQAHDADSRAVPNSRRGVVASRISYAAVDRMLAQETYDVAMRISGVTTAAGAPLAHPLV